MPKTTNSSTCLVCGNALVKNGFTSAGTRRWRCLNCGSSSTRKRADLTRRHILDRFQSWLLGKDSQTEAAARVSDRTFRREIEWCWQLRPTLPTVTIPPRCVIVVGTYFGGWCLLVALDEDLTPLAFQRCSTETQAAWGALFARIPAPLAVVCDGGPGLNAALNTVWPDTRVQRCIFHILMNIRTLLTWKPRTVAGQTLLALTKQLSQVQTPEDALGWLKRLNAWHSIYGHLTRERSYARRRLKDGSWDSPTGKQWWYTHDRLRKTYRLLTEIQRRGHLFTFVQIDIPRTTSGLEGAFNSVLKTLLRVHRGMPTEHQKRVAEWFALKQAGLLQTAYSFITPEVINPPVDPRPRFTEPDPGPELYGTGLDASEGLWLRKGWGGQT